MTRQREVILQTIRQSPEHLTADQIYFLTKQQLPSIALATVYNNLKSLSADGTIRRLHIDDGPDRFDKSSLPHEHLVCSGCGEITDVAIPDLQAKLEGELGIEIESYDLSMQYICNQCRKSQ